MYLKARLKNILPEEDVQLMVLGRTRQRIGPVWMAVPDKAEHQNSATFPGRIPSLGQYLFPSLIIWGYQTDMGLIQM